NFLKRLAYLGPLRRKLRTNCTRLLTRRDAQRLDIFTEISNPICQFVQLPPEFLMRSVTRRLWIFHRLNFINTLLQRGDSHEYNLSNRFSGFVAFPKTAKAVPRALLSSLTSLKRGVNEKRSLSKRKTKTEVERTEVFELPRIGIDAVIEANWSDGQLVAQACTDGVPHIA